MNHVMLYASAFTFYQVLMTLEDYRAIAKLSDALAVFKQWRNGHRTRQTIKG